MSEECPQCGVTFASPPDLLAHVRKEHRQPNPAASLARNPASQTPGVTCALCGRTFATPEALAEHDLVPHRLGRRFGRSVPM
jgi:C2H2-type zinc finger protein/C2H2 type zinc finger protein